MSETAFVLPERIENTQVWSLRDQLLSRRAAPLEIDGRGTERVSTLGAQLLVSAALQWRADAQTLRILASPQLARDMTNLGFGIPELEERDRV